MMLTKYSVTMYWVIVYAYICLCGLIIQDHRSPLHFGASYGHISVVKLLITLGANIDAIDKVVEILIVV